MKLKLRVGILSLPFLTMSALVITSAFSAIIKSFPTESIAKIQMIGTIPSLGTLVATLVVGFLAAHVPKKILALIGLFLVGLGGLLPLVLHGSVNELLGCALLLGIGLGFTTPVTPMLIAMYFDGDERAAVMGENTAINSLGSIVMMLFGGFLGATNWVSTYFAFFATVIVFGLVFFFLPMDHVSYSETGAPTVSTLQLFKGLNKYVWIAAMIGLLMSLIYTIYPSNLSIIVDSKQLGGTSTTGIINAVGTVGGFVAGFGLNKINKVVKDKTLGVGFIAMMLTFLLIRVATSLWVVLLGGILSGFAMAMVMATIPFYVSIVSAPIEVAVAMTVFQFMNSLGGVFTPLILKWLHINSGDQAFVAGIIASAVMALLCFATNIGKRVQKESVSKKDKKLSTSEVVAST